ncbi:hypothetical protein ACHAXS_003142 [Conticribra weissflogii]
MNSIRIILDHRAPSLEQEIKDYLKSVIQSTIEDEGISAAVENLSTTINEFLSKDVSCLVLSDILELQKKHTATGKKFSIQSDESDPRRLMTLQLEESEDLLSPVEYSCNKSHQIPVVDFCTQTDNENSKSNGSNSPSSPKTKSKIEQRREARMQKRAAKKSKGKPSSSPSPDRSTSPTSKKKLDLVNDDHASAWQECQESNKFWGGRGHGGRGIRITGNNFQTIHLPSVSLCYEGNELLVESTMDIIKGHRYGLLGRNGVGKSTLLRQLEAGGIPGLPRGMVVRMVKQQVEGRDDQTTLEALVAADEYRTSLLEEQEKIEKEMDEGLNLEENALRLGDVAVELDAIDAENAEKRALDILKGLSFTRDMIYGRTASLSGGWRMRLALAQALFAPYSDLILLDECTNHLDLHGMAWLEGYLTDEKRKDDLTLICVSHDRNFLDAVCTDMVVMEHKRLSYHVGNYSDYKQKMQEKAARESQILDAAERQRSKAMEFVQKQQQMQSKKSSDPNKQRQAKMIKEKKFDRIGNYREDGKKYKLKSLKKLSEDHIRLAQKVVVEVDDPVIRLKFPDPVWPPSIAEGSPIVELEDVSFSYNKDDGSEGKHLLRHVTTNLTQHSKIAVVGRNGCGKTTLLKLLTGDLNGIGNKKGKIWKHPNVRIGHVTQHSIEDLEQFAQMTVVQYAERVLSSGSASKEVIAKASGNVRQYLGAFGLGGSHALRTIAKLSGGERMRLCFATVFADEPHILLLDESTNHVDLETLDSMAEALRAYRGAVIMVSHNQGFLSGFCNELWALDNAKLDVSQSDAESFDDLFSRYRNDVLSSRVGASARQQERHVKTSMAKRAAKQSASTTKHTTLL